MPFTRSRRMRYQVKITQDEDGVYVAEVPALPGCVSDGDTREEAIANVREAIALHVESLEAHGRPVPASTEDAVVDVQ